MLKLFNFPSKNKQSRTGFTLAEMIIVVAAFALIASIAINLTMSATRAQRKSIALQNIQDSSRYLLAFMTKEIRMSEINSPDSPVNGVAVLDITHPVNGSVNYTFTGEEIERTDSADSSVINSGEVKIDGKFIIDGKALGDNEQPRVTIIMKTETVDVQKIEEQAEINLQTTISQRNLD